MPRPTGSPGIGWQSWIYRARIRCVRRATRNDSLAGRSSSPLSSRQHAAATIVIFTLASAEPRAGGLQEFVMQVWIGFKQAEEYVHEWTGEVAQEEDVGAAIGNAIADYRTKSGKPIWGMSIMVDKARELPDRVATA
jgi:hypothetical protein